MVQLQSRYADFQAAGTQLIAISYDSVKILKAFADKNKIAFPLLSDADSKVIEAFHIQNDEAPEKWAGIPHPGTFIVDEKGVIRAKLFLESYRDRHPAAVVLDKVKEAKEKG